MILIRLNRLGWSQEQIAKEVGFDRSINSRIVQNTKISDMHNLLSQGYDMQYIARHYNMDLPLVWTLRLEEKTYQEKFKELGWGLLTWDQLDFNECLPR
ncbi:MAG: hypothetical protein JRF50_12300 [Deltaproteobacteria bacterium]|nr:hypothetical protein [Deltaproteobacteria bacterium]